MSEGQAGRATPTEARLAGMPCSYRQRWHPPCRGRHFRRWSEAVTISTSSARLRLPLSNSLGSAVASRSMAPLG